MENIVILCGSPRKNGNSDLMAQTFAQNLTSNYHAELLSVSDLKIAPCRACNCCFANGHRCVQEDDMQKVYDSLAHADILGIVSPVYFYGISAQLSALINRLHNPIRDDFPIRKAFLMLTAASHKPYVCDGIKTQYLNLLKNFGIENLGIIAAQGVNAPGDIVGTPYLEEVKVLAQTL